MFLVAEEKKMKESVLLAKRQSCQTSHIFHLFMTLFTAGFWLPAWLLVAVLNSRRRYEIDKELEKI